jgi:hypothetical protein
MEKNSSDGRQEQTMKIDPRYKHLADIKCGYYLGSVDYEPYGELIITIDGCESASGSARPVMNDREYICALRDELATLRARYDGGAVPVATYSVIKELETTISWLEHCAGRRGWRSK